LIAGGALGQQKYELSDTDEWNLVNAVDPSTPAGQLATARRALAAGENKRAANLATEWIERYPRDPLLPNAYLLRGDALVARGQYFKALFDYEFVARAYPASEAFVTVIQRELEIGVKYARGMKRLWLGLRLLNADDVAEELLIRVQERMPGSRLAEEAAIELADHYFRKREMRLAVEMYSIFLENHPASDQVSKARRRLIYSELATFKGPPFDASGLHEARARLNELIAIEPAAAERLGADALLIRIDESDAQKLLVTAKWYLATGDPIATELIIRRLVTRYPRTVAAADALRLMRKVEPLLPPTVFTEAPDYAALQRAILGGRPGEIAEP
jgi:outer membrane protein assembly factor BamD (BamD/ComL family)